MFKKTLTKYREKLYNTIVFKLTSVKLLASYLSKIIGLLQQ